MVVRRPRLALRFGAPVVNLVNDDVQPRAGA